MQLNITFVAETLIYYRSNEHAPIPHFQYAV